MCLVAIAKVKDQVKCPKAIKAAPCLLLGPAGVRAGFWVSCGLQQHGKGCSNEGCIGCHTQGRVVVGPDPTLVSGPQLADASLQVVAG